nr:MAG TPA: hypothetical protein [Caudoviricetes sp.]DAT27462.1 MAG TPA: hypothetical protein [Caudoviricetes sp.]
MNYSDYQRSANALRRSDSGLHCPSYHPGCSTYA